MRPTARVSMDVRFVIVAPAKARKSFKVRLPVVVGRGDDVKVRIQQDSVSRRHCEFALDGGAVTVTDLGSTNGTLVAGTRIEPHAATAVPSGAEVRIGGTVLRVEYAGSAAPAAVAPHEADTVPLLAAGESAGDLLELEPMPDLEPLPESEPLPDLEPVGETVAAEAAPTATVPAFPAVDEPAPASAFAGTPDVEPASAPAAVPEFPDVEAAPPPAEGSFDFLGGEAAPPPAADDKLDDFFKSLS